jgi:hypothetical protein
MRDAIEDDAYLAMLQRRGTAAEAEQIARPLAELFFAWEKDPRRVRPGAGQARRVAERGQGGALR